VLSLFNLLNSLLIKYHDNHYRLKIKPGFFTQETDCVANSFFNITLRFLYVSGNGKFPHHMEP